MFANKYFLSNLLVCCYIFYNKKSELLVYYYKKGLAQNQNRWRSFQSNVLWQELRLRTNNKYKQFFWCSFFKFSKFIFIFLTIIYSSISFCTLPYRSPITYGLLYLFLTNFPLNCCSTSVMFIFKIVISFSVYSNSALTWCRYLKWMISDSYEIKIRWRRFQRSFCYGLC